MTTPQRLKVLLHNQGEDAETPWAEDLGPHPAKAGARLVRLVNVPFLHAKPTFGDVLVVEPDAEGMLAWDRQGVPWDDLDSRIEGDGGRWVMIIDYEAPSRELASDLARWLDEQDYICEGPGPGRLYLALPAASEVGPTFASVAANPFGVAVTLVHPVDDAEED